MSTQENPDSAFDFVTVMTESEGILRFVLFLLLFASAYVWLLWVAKFLQLKRIAKANRKFEEATLTMQNPEELIALAHETDAANARCLVEVAKRKEDEALSQELLLAAAERAMTREEQRASAWMPTLASIASSTPFIGLFGTVYGIMQAFRLIGLQKSASLPVVAPAIGEALIATAVGLMAAIPATIAYNFLDKRIADFVDELKASLNLWVQQVYAYEMKERARSGLRRTGS
ncbi:MAG: MotA/TolQ/ExbB proton channel family protein [Polyangiaceae bacterium]|nr:MotA/TolQ/ExbB proton channel family protein [Polyangiaceae bacterium]